MFIVVSLKLIGGEAMASTVDKTGNLRSTRVVVCEDSGLFKKNVLSKVIGTNGASTEYVYAVSTSTQIPPTCRLVQEMPVAVETIVWAGLWPTSFMPSLDKLIILEGDFDQQKRFIPYSMEKADAEPEQPTGQALVLNKPKQELLVSEKPAQPIKKSSSKQLPAKRSGWVWLPEFWQWSPVEPQLDQLSHWGIQVVYVFIPLSDDGEVANPIGLKRFIQAASKRQIQVYAVDGDPTAILPEHHSVYVKRTQAYVAYNRSVMADAKLSGVQYDFEPYSLPGFFLEPISFHQSHVSLLTSLRSVAQGLTIEIAVPASYLLTPQTRGNYFLERVPGLIDTLVLMDYKTDLDTIVSQAEPFLTWGQSKRIPVKIALEAGELGDPQLQLFRRANSGTFFLFNTSSNSQYLAVLTNEAVTIKNGTGYAFVRNIKGNSQSMTFYGQKDTLKSLIPVLENRLSKYASFSGVALHDILKDEL
jgi:hypothetical protein